MKKTLLVFAAASVLYACNSSQTTEQTSASGTEATFVNASFYGDTISADGALTTAELLSQMAGKDSLYAKVEGEIEECCQAKGCWMKVKLADGTLMRVTFKDYGFFVPKDANGKRVVMDGVAFYKETSVERLQHYAEDGGASKEEIAKITEPETGLAFEAHGVVINN
jgi:hypothetical protein